MPVTLSETRQATRADEGTSESEGAVSQCLQYFDMTIRWRWAARRPGSIMMMLMLVARKNLKERLGAILEEATRALRGPTFPVYGGVPVGQVTQVTSESRPSQVGPLSSRGPAFSMRRGPGQPEAQLEASSRNFEEC